MQEIMIKISEAGIAAARTFAYEIIADGRVIAQGSLNPVQSQQVHEIGSQYFSLLEEKGRGQAASYLPLLREALGGLFLKSGEQDWRECIELDARLVISSSIPEVLQLPWELLGPLPSGMEGLRVIRRPVAEGEASPSWPEPSAGPLRLLLLSSNNGAWEEEEKAVLELAEGLEMEVVICERGTGQELIEAAKRFRPHLIHLAVPFRAQPGGAAVSLPVRSGEKEEISAEGLAGELNDAVYGIIVSSGGMGSAQGLHIFCQRLSDKMPLALAWHAAAALLRSFYQALADGASPEDALLCLSARGSEPSGAKPLLPYPALYSEAGAIGPMIASEAKKVASDFRACLRVPALPGLTEGAAECFVGRRADIARLLPALREGGVHTLAVTGPTGSGKSALAVHLCRLLAPAGYSVLPLYRSPKNPITWARLLESVASNLKATGQEGQARELIRTKAAKESMDNLINVLGGSRLLLLWDGLELDQSGRIPDPDLSQFYRMMIRGLGASRAIITCPSLPAEALTLPDKAWQWKAEALSQSQFVRRLLYMPAVADRYRMGRISFAALADHHRAASGLPLCLNQTASALDLADMAAGEDALAALISRLNQASLAALCRTSVYEIAVSPAGIAAVCGLAEEQVDGHARSWQALSLAQNSSGLWTVPAAVRPSLQASLGREEIESAHRAAAGFLQSLAEAGRSQEMNLSRLDVLLEARGHYMAAGDWQSATVTTGRISGYLRRRGHYGEIMRLNRELLDLNASSPIQAEPAAWIGQAYLDQEDYKRAEEWYERALQISPEPAYYHGLGLSLMHEEKFDLARSKLQKAHDAYSQANHLSGQMEVLSSLAAIDMKTGEIEAALEKMERVTGIMRQLGDQPGEAQALQETARLDMMLSNFDSARSRLQRSLELLESSGDRRGAAFALFNLASLDLEKGDFQTAAEEYARALPLFRAMEDRGTVSAILHSQGLIQAQAGEKEMAVKSFKEALAINQDLEDKAAEAGSFFQLGALAVQQERMEEGLKLMATAAVVLRSIKSDEVRNVEPLVERLASQLNYSQEQFMVMVQEVLKGYSKDRGWGLVERASSK